MQKIKRITIKTAAGDFRKVVTKSLVGVIFGEAHTFKEKASAFDPSQKDVVMRGIFRSHTKMPNDSHESDTLLLPEKITAKIRAGGSGTGFLVKIIADKGGVLSYELDGLQTPESRIKAMEEVVKAQTAPAKK